MIGVRTDVKRFVEKSRRYINVTLVFESVTIALTNSVELSLPSVKVSESGMIAHKSRSCKDYSRYVREEEDSPDDDRGDTEGPEEPGESGLNIDSGERKIQSRSESCLELREGHNDRLHALGCLGKRILQRRDGSLTTKIQRWSKRNTYEVNVRRSRKDQRGCRVHRQSRH